MSTRADKEAQLSPQVAHHCPFISQAQALRTKNTKMTVICGHLFLFGDTFFKHKKHKNRPYSVQTSTPGLL